jgi:phenylalanine ammonia-lyase
MDLPDRCRTAVRESLGTVLELVEEFGPAGEVSMTGIRVYQEQTAVALEQCYGELRQEFFRHQTTAEYISPASKVVYEFVRKELKIPLNRGVEDHPPLLLRKAEAFRGRCNGDVVEGDEDSVEVLAERGRTLGTMAGEIYEALRRGELHDRIMKFGEEAGMWGC